MFQYLISILKTNNTNSLLLQNLLIIAIIAFILLVYKNYYNFKFSNNSFLSNNNLEGFTQNEKFVLKENQNIYDNFYSEIYDNITSCKLRSQWELLNIIKMTDPDTNNSVILDVGCGTGYRVNELQKVGFRAYGIDHSESMVKQCNKLYPDIIVKHADVFDPMTYEKKTMTHILCMNMTIYEFKNKLQFFRNCSHWIMPNGYLILHLVDPELFSATVPIHKNKWREPINSKKRVVDTLVDFYDFNYHAHYEFPFDLKKNKSVVFKEKFTDKMTNFVRQNENTLYMDSINDILKMANLAGFIFHGKMNMKGINQDENQYLYVLEKLM